MQRKEKKPHGIYLNSLFVHKWKKIFKENKFTGEHHTNVNLKQFFNINVNKATKKKKIKPIHWLDLNDVNLNGLFIHCNI